MFDIKTVLDLHDRVLTKYGGASGVRDSNLLDSALNRPFQTFGGEDLYPTFYEKAAAVIHSVILNHPFVDGNKRNGFLLGETLLLNYYVEIKATENDCYDFVIKISTGELSFEDIVLRLQQNTQPTSL
jgi:death-on-curing protein